MNLTAKLLQGEIMSSSLLDQQLYLDRSTTSRRVKDGGPIRRTSMLALERGSN